jgi:hypothetical protein
VVDRVTCQLRAVASDMKKTVLVCLVLCLGTMSLLAGAAQAATTPRRAALRTKACLLRANPRIRVSFNDGRKGIIARWPGNAPNAGGYNWASMTYSAARSYLITAYMDKNLRPWQRRLFRRCLVKS